MCLIWNIGLDQAMHELKTEYDSQGPRVTTYITFKNYKIEWKIY